MSRSLDIAARHDEILGCGPRIEPLRLEDMSSQALAITERMLNATSKERQEASFEKVPELVPTLLRYPELFSRLTDLSLHLLTSGCLSDRDRELVVLRSAWLSQAPYEWGEHVEIAKRVGISTEEIERITLGSTAGAWIAHEAALLKAVEELQANAMIANETWHVLAQQLNEKQLIELPILVGQFQSVAFLQNALRMRLEPHNKGLSAR